MASEGRTGARGRRSRAPLFWLLAAAAAALLAFNLSIAIPVGSALAKDSRNQGLQLVAYRTWLVHPTEVTVDLWRVPETAAPVDLFRGLMQTAEALKDRGFTRVVVARKAKPIFVLPGEDFQDMGQAYALGENPIYLVRTLPEKLHRPDGGQAFGTWEGGWLGVLSRQMDDVNRFAVQWVSGSDEPPPSDQP